MSAVPIVVTGGIASGKSTVTSLFGRLGIEVCDADVLARALVEPGQPALDEIVRRWGTDVLDAGGALDRNRMRQRVFAHPEDRLALEAIIHPRVREALQRAASQAIGPYVLLAVPLFVESGDYAWVRRVLLVDIPEDLQRERLAARDGGSEQQAAQILAAQASRRQRWAAAQDVIINDGPREQLADMVARLDRRYRALAGR